MKKTIFTVCSVVALCAVVFLACTKEDNGNKQVSYSSQPGYGGGNNPNPNNYPSSSGTTTTPTNTVPVCSKTLTYDGIACSTVTSTISGNTVSESGNCTSLTMVFPGTGAPATGTYFVVVGSLAAGQCNFTGGGAPASGGTVSITTGTSNKAAFTGIVCGTHTLTGTACY